MNSALEQHLKGLGEEILYLRPKWDHIHILPGAEGGVECTFIFLTTWKQKKMHAESITPAMWPHLLCDEGFYHLFLIISKPVVTCSKVLCRSLYVSAAFVLLKQQQTLHNSKTKHHSVYRPSVEGRWEFEDSKALQKPHKGCATHFGTSSVFHAPNHR